MDTTSIAIIVVGIIVAGVLLIKYLNGDYTIIKTEEVERNSYNVSKRNSLLETEFPAGKLTRIVYKITYNSGRIKFKTKEYNH